MAPFFILGVRSVQVSDLRRVEMIERLGIVCYLIAGLSLAVFAYEGRLGDGLVVAAIFGAPGYIFAGKPWEKE